MSLATQADLEKFSQTDFQNEPLDASVGAWLDAATAIIEGYCGRKLEETSAVEETLDGSGHKLLHVAEGFPITAVNSITEDGTALVDGTDFVWYPDGRLVRIIGDYDYAWKKKRQSVVVNYDYGYAAGSIPADLIAVCCFLTERIFVEGAEWANVPAGAGGPVESLTFGTTGDSVSYAVSDVDRDGRLGGVQLLTGADRRLLSPWVRRF